MTVGQVLLTTTRGVVEAVVTGHSGAAVLYFHGGHESATATPAAGLYRELGYRVVALSRPGYGRTKVERLPPGRFARLADEVRAALHITRFLAVVGVSFGGFQAIEYAGRHPDRVDALVLHSAAPSTWPYPDSRAQRALAPILFHPLLEGLVWGAAARLLRRWPELGLRLMMAPLSTRSGSTWLGALPHEERQEMRAVFLGMRSGSGFVTDLRQATARTSGLRRRALQRVACPALVTASREDGGVAWRHALDLRDTIPRASLVEIPAPSHLFWIGAQREQVAETIREFLTTAGQ